MPYAFIVFFLNIIAEMENNPHKKFNTCFICNIVI